MSNYAITLLIILLIIIVYKWVTRNDSDEMEIIPEPIPIETGTERYHRIAHASILHHGLKTIDLRLKRCDLIVEQREGLTFKFWKDTHGRVVQMMRSDGQGYIQLFGPLGESFGTVWITPGNEPDATVHVNSAEYARDMKWFLENNY